MPMADNDIIIKFDDDDPDITSGVIEWENVNIEFNGGKPTKIQNGHVDISKTYDSTDQDAVKYTRFDSCSKRKNFLTWRSVIVEPEFYHLIHGKTKGSAEFDCGSTSDYMMEGEVFDSKSSAVQYMDFGDDVLLCEDCFDIYDTICKYVE